MFLYYHYHHGKIFLYCHHHHHKIFLYFYNHHLYITVTIFSVLFVLFFSALSDRAKVLALLSFFLTSLHSFISAIFSAASSSVSK